MPEWFFDNILFWRLHIQGIDRLAKMTNDSEQEDRWSHYTLHRSSLYQGEFVGRAHKKDKQTQTHEQTKTETHWPTKIPTHKQRQPTSGHNWKPRSRFKLTQGRVKYISFLSLLGRLNFCNFIDSKNYYKTHQHIYKMQGPSRLITRFTDRAPTEKRGSWMCSIFLLQLYEVNFLLICICICIKSHSLI